MLLVAQAAAADVWPMAKWKAAKPEDVGLDAALLAQARKYALTGGGAGYVTRGGKLVLSWGDVKKRFDLKSTSKSIGVTALGLAIADGKMALTDLASQRHPKFGIPPESNAASGWLDKITLLHLATQTAGFEKPGGYDKLLFEPGTKWAYSDGGPNWLAECVTLAYRQDVDKLLFDRVFTPLGISRSDLDMARRTATARMKIEGIARREFGSGISANVDAMARIGLLYLRGRPLERKADSCPASSSARRRRWSRRSSGCRRSNEKEYGKASDHYGLLWWNNADGTLADVPRDAYLVMGLVRQPDRRHSQPRHRRLAGRHVVEAKRRRSLRRAEAVFGPDRGGRQGVRKRQADGRKACALQSKTADTPYPPSAVIRHIDWAPASTIVRQCARQRQLAADLGRRRRALHGLRRRPRLRAVRRGEAQPGPGQDQRRAERFCRRSICVRRRPSSEATAPPARRPADMLMVDGVLYLLARNAGNSQLAWSRDHGKTLDLERLEIRPQFRLSDLLELRPRLRRRPRRFCLRLFARQR